MMLQKIKQQAPIFFCYLVIIVFSLKNFREPDLWWQIRTGDYIIETKSVPTHDVFSYTFKENTWVNIKWGFEVVAALIVKIFGIESVFFLQVVVSCLLLYFVIKTTRLLLVKHNLNTETTQAILPLLIFIFLVGISYRIIGRPEMISHLLTAVFIYLLFKYKDDDSKRLFILIPLQVLWVNFHEGFVTGIVILFVFLASSWIEYFLFKKATKKPIILSFVVLASLISLLINPYGFRILESPFNIFKQVYDNKFTTEFLGVNSYYYWTKEAYIALGMLVFVLLVFLANIRLKNKKKNDIELLKKYGVTPFILIALFTYLASTVYRNIIFLDIIILPFFVLMVCSVLSKIESKKRIVLFAKIAPVLSLAVGVVFYILIVSNKYYQLTESNDRFGLEVLSINNPEGAAGYIEQHQLSDKRVFCDYLVSAYLIWRLPDSFQSFIDMRDLEIFPLSFFDRFAQATVYPKVFNELDSQYHFEYAVLFRNQFLDLHQYLYNNPSYSLVFADAVACIYKKQPIKYNTTVFSSCKPFPQNTTARVINTFFNPLYKPYNYSSIDRNLLAANFYLTEGNVSLAKQYAIVSAATGSEKYIGEEVLAQIYIKEAASDTNISTQATKTDSANFFIQKCLKKNSSYATAYFDLGILSFRNQYYKEAIKHFDKAISLGSKSVDTYIYTAEANKALSGQNGPNQKKYIESAIANYLKADQLSPNNPITIANLGFLYFRIENCDRATFYLNQVKDFDGMSETSRQDVKNCLKSCNN